jgi:hypothetical protein
MNELQINTIFQGCILKPYKHGNIPVAIYDGFWIWKKYYMACWRCDCQSRGAKKPALAIREWNKQYESVGA